MFKQLLFILAITSISTVQATVFLNEDFEGGLVTGGSSGWTGNSSGQVVTDPLQGDNAVNFTRTAGGNDLYTDIFTSGTGKFFVSFDYLGTCGGSSCGGYVHFSPIGWIGTQIHHNVHWPRELIDDNQWHTHSFEITSNTLRVKFQDWNGAGPNAEDAYFDNIIISDIEHTAYVPEPSALAFLWLGLSSIGFTIRRRKVNKVQHINNK
ncbi:PEP-CTERM sorting domain-containing protein [Photobacterium minamisatsumaniensis]|uniref:PEP-CTERM sorting domain-containing protein n=1 Tax=Photobacterium minamisatsumaniensis TaxID=2910233 RepID=UPI003D0D1AC4